MASSYLLAFNFQALSCIIASLFPVMLAQGVPLVLSASLVASAKMDGVTLQYLHHWEQSSNNQPQQSRHASIHRHANTFIFLAQKLASISPETSACIHIQPFNTKQTKPCLTIHACCGILLSSCFQLSSTILYHVFSISCHPASGCPVSVVSEPCGLSENGWRDTSVPSSLKAVVQQPAATIEPCWYPSPCEHLHLSCTKACKHKSWNAEMQHQTNQALLDQPCLL